MPFSSQAYLERYVPGVVVGEKYRLDRMLGEGGMGSVWAAQNVALDSAVAIKLIRGEGNRADMELRLLQEARAAARLGHPAIVRVFDIGRTQLGDPFIVMELLEGESLGAKLFRDWRLSAIEAVKLLLPIADALRAAHGKGIVHRDIKPDNVFLVADGQMFQPKLVDFGIAKLEQRELVTHQTERGVVVGSPEYMSPEQARGMGDIDHRSDIWSFCVVLYQAVSGVVPFAGDNYNALLRSIVEDKPVSLMERAAGDSELSSVLEVGMAKDRGARWRSIDEVGVALARWLFKQGVFEDAAGGSLDARWLNRLSDSGRNSRGSFPSLSGEMSPHSGMAVTQAPPRLEPSAHGPTFLAPGTARTNRRRAIRLAALAFAFTAVVALAFWLFRPAPEQARSPVQSEQRSAEQPAVASRPAPAEIVSGTATAAPVAAPAPSAQIQPALSTSARGPQDRGKKAGRNANSGAKRNLDLIAPY